MDAVATGRVLHVGTYNGNPLCKAAGRAALGEICTPDETTRIIERNARFVADCHALLSARGMPAHAVQCGAKECVTWSASPVRNYRDYLATDFDPAFAQWIWGVNRGVLLPPRLDEQWLLSVVHSDADLALALDRALGIPRCARRSLARRAGVLMFPDQRSAAPTLNAISVIRGNPGRVSVGSCGLIA